MLEYTRPWFRILVVLCCNHAASLNAQTNQNASGHPGIAQSAIVWDTPSTNSLGSMPIGNGDIGANVWVEPTGDLLLLLSKTDAYDDFGRLLKVGRMRIKTEPALLPPGTSFTQSLNMRDGCIELNAGSTTLRVWIDAHHPSVQIDCQSAAPITVEAAAEIWRTKTRKLDRVRGKEKEEHSSYGNFPEQRMVHSDTVLPHDASGIAWCHRNIESIWKGNLEHTGLAAEITKHIDPLLGRTFGAVVRGTGMKPASDLVLKSVKPAREVNIQITLLTHFADSPGEWHQAANALADRLPCDRASRFDAHRTWWRDFWNRSWIVASGQSSPAEADARLVTQAYTEQRYLNACAGRGNLPIKFNGSIFTVGQVFDADYRRWGGPYWLQNTRLIYWPMLEAGDYDLMQPFFKMYRDMLPLRQAAASTYFGHGGAHFGETMHFWGNYTDENYGFNRTNLPVGMTSNTYIRRYWANSLELAGMMLDYYEATEDGAFRDQTLIPMASEIFRFFDEHWKRDENGKIRYEPAQSLETYHDVVNPTPEIAAIRYLLPRLLKLPVSDAIRAEWKRQLADQPEIRLRTVDGKTLIPPAERFGKSANLENPELYAVFPFRLYTLMNASEKDLQIGIDTFNARRFQKNIGWHQDPIQAAMLGLTPTVQSMILQRVKQKAAGHRFPGFYGPNYDWTPDQDHPSVFQAAFQYMLMQCEGEKIRLLPAWPKEWNVNFKLHAPRQTMVECEVKDGTIIKLLVTPEARRRDVVVSPPFRTIPEHH